MTNIENSLGTLRPPAVALKNTWGVGDEWSKWSQATTVSFNEKNVHGASIIATSCAVFVGR